MEILISLTDCEGVFHKHNNYEIIAFSKGSGTFFSDGIETEVFPGKFIIVPPNTFHRCNFDMELERIYIQGDFNRSFSFTVPVIVTDNSDGDGLILAKMIYANQYSASDYVSALVNAFTHFLLQSLKTDDAISFIIKDIITKITNDFCDSTLDVGALLRKSGYAVDYIRTKFKAITGKTPVEFLTQIRINHARYLIDIYKSSLSLSEIAERCGYTDYIYFSRRFKQFTGMSPREYMSI